MKQIFKLYRHYLKKLLKSWNFWIFVAFSIFISLALPYFLFVFTKKTIPKTISYKEWLGGVLIPNLIREQGLSGFPSSQDNWKEIASNFWQISSKRILGFAFTFVFLSPAVSALISTPPQDGEDKTVLSIASPIKRDDLVISKILSLFTYFWMGIFLTLTLPYFFYYCFVMGFSAKVIFILLLTTGLVFPLLLFLIFVTPLIFFDMLGWLLRVLFGFFLAILVSLWYFIKIVPFKNETKEIINKIGETFSSNFLVIVPVALIIGTLFLYLYRERFRKKDF